MNTIFANAVADLSINLSAGCFGAAFIAPTFLRRRKTIRIFFLTNYLTSGMLWLGLAYYLRSQI